MKVEAPAPELNAYFPQPLYIFKRTSLDYRFRCLEAGTSGTMLQRVKDSCGRTKSQVNARGWLLSGKRIGSDLAFKHILLANLGVCQTLASLPGAATPGRAATHLCRRARSCEGRGSNEISWNVFMWSYFARLHFVFFSFDLMPELASLPARGTRPQPAVLPPATPPEQPITTTRTCGDTSRKNVQINLRI